MSVRSVQRAEIKFSRIPLTSGVSEWRHGGAGAERPPGSEGGGHIAGGRNQENQRCHHRSEGPSQRRCLRPHHVHIHALKTPPPLIELP